MTIYGIIRSYIASSIVHCFHPRINSKHSVLQSTLYILYRINNFEQNFFATKKPRTVGFEPTRGNPN